MTFNKYFIVLVVSLMLQTNLSCGNDDPIEPQGNNEVTAQGPHEREFNRENLEQISQNDGEQSASNQSLQTSHMAQEVKQALWDNKGFINHTIGDLSTVLARMVFHNPTMELVESSYRWLSGGYMWYENDQQRQSYPSQLMDIKYMAVLAHLGADALDVLFTYMPGIIEAIPGGAYVEGGIQLTAGVTYFTIAGITGYLTYEKIQAYTQQKKKKDH